MRRGGTGALLGPARRGLGIDIHRDIARLNGRMVGVQYAEGLDVGRMLIA